MNTVLHIAHERHNRDLVMGKGTADEGKLSVFVFFMSFYIQQKKTQYIILRKERTRS